MLHTARTRDWAYAFIFLAAVSAFFLALRFLGRAFIAMDFEVLIIHVPTAICLLVFVARSLGVAPKPATAGSHESRR